MSAARVPLNLALVVLDLLLVVLPELRRLRRLRAPLRQRRLLELVGDLLERNDLRIGDEKICVDEDAGAERTLVESGEVVTEFAQAQVARVGVHHLGRDRGDDRIPEPAGCGAEHDPARTDGQREDSPTRPLSGELFRVNGLTTKSGEDDTGLLGFVAVDEATRGLWEKEETGAEDKTLGKLDTDGDPIRACVWTTLGGVVDA
ncbi:hypothetical protein BU15DRAFT_63396 [Melanogaster broomeanus]|nr:hypothetical protein BU15DRAFT_63396 [Melanogaster broomeanus]